MTTRRARQRRSADAVHRAEGLLDKLMAQLDEKLETLREHDKRKKHSFEEEWEPGTNDDDEGKPS